MAEAFGIFRTVVLAMVVAIAGVFSEGAHAGGGPENVALVVNLKSSDSLTIANHFVQLRKIPSANVILLEWDPKDETTDVDTFREKILTPILATIQQRRLAPQIDYIVYSSDFPWGIDLTPDKKRVLEAAEKELARRRAAAEKAAEENDKEDGKEKPKLPEKPVWPKPLTTVGSINGLTYFWQPVLAKSGFYLHLENNFYMRRPIAEQRDEPTLGFRSSQGFGPKGRRLKDKGVRYMLSTMLGVTSGRGNSVEEVIRYLRRSAGADGTHPRGTIYYMKNSDIRSKSRDATFDKAVAELEKLGVSAEVLSGKIPKNKPDVQGTMVGTASFDWKSSGSTIRPGAICEHFTSFGGVMRSKAGQTPLSEFLRFGAAGASGTVTEPYSIGQKFPHPFIQVHYASGCTLAESFYQSVHGPYQLLIVGDPLCRPWANIPKVTVEGVKPGDEVKGMLKIRPNGTVPNGIEPNGGRIDQFDLFVDGLRVAACSWGGTLAFDTTRLADGHHELRVVAIEDGLIASQGRTVIPVTFANHGRRITTSVTPKGVVRSGTPLLVSASSPKAVGIVVLYNSRIIGRVAGSDGKVEIDTSKLGHGPARLRVVALGEGGLSTCAWGKPFVVDVLAK